MFVGGCAGSTAGGLKVSRFMLMTKMIKKELRHMLHPRSVSSVKLEGKRIDEVTQNSIFSYFTLFMMFYFVVFLIISLDNFDFTTNFTAVAATFNNIGPGLSLVGPSANFGFLSNFSKWVLTFDMLAGRLELFPLLLLFHPKMWLDVLQNKRGKSVS